MKLTLNPNPRYDIDIKNECLIDTITGIKFTKDKISYLNTKFYGLETKHYYNWYEVFAKLDIKISSVFRKYINHILIRKCNVTGNELLTKYIIQTKEPVLYKYEEKEYAVLFRFGYLAISKDGYIINLNNNTIIKSPFNVEINNEDDYKYYSIENKRHLIHRLILEAWVYNENPIKKIYGNHKDLNKHNNTLDNLEWVTPQENTKHLFMSNASQQNILCRIKHKNKQDVKTFYSIKEMCIFLNISQQDFSKYPYGYLYNGYEIRIGNDNTDWYYKTGKEIELSKFATIKIELYKHNKYIKTFYNIDSIIEYLNIKKTSSLSDIKNYGSNNDKGYTIEIMNLTKTGPYDVKNIKTSDIKTFTTFPEISRYIGYNESSIRVFTDTNKLVKSIYAIKSKKNEWFENYEDTSLNTKPKKYRLVNLIDKTEIISNSFIEATKIVNVTKKTLKKYIDKHTEIKGFKIYKV